MISISACVSLPDVEQTPAQVDALIQAGHLEEAHHLAKRLLLRDEKEKGRENPAITPSVNRLARIARLRGHATPPDSS
jgi:hypothetical protein